MGDVSSRNMDPMIAFRQSHRLPWWLVALDAVLILIIVGTLAYLVIEMNNLLEGKRDTHPTAPAMEQVAGLPEWLEIGT